MLGQDEVASTESTESKKEPPPYNWQAERAGNLSGNRKTIHANRPEEVFGMVEEVPDYKDKGYKILSKETMETPTGLWDNYFLNYSAAKDYLHTNWPEDEILKWQLVEVEAAESETVIS